MLLRDALGETLRDARMTQNRTLRDVSTAANVSLGYLSEVERGRKEASSELLAAICEALDLDLAEVLIDVGRHLRDDAEAKRKVAANSPRPQPKVTNAPHRPDLRIVVPYAASATAALA